MGDFYMKLTYRNQAGFTLLELLIAATIVGILALFATVSYRNSVAQTRFSQARGVVQVLAMGNYRAHIDYPNITFDAKPISDVVQGTTGSSTSGETSVCSRGFASNPYGKWSSSCLVANGYVDAMGFNGYFDFTLYGSSSACMKANNDKLGEKYANYFACYNAATSRWSVERASWKKSTGGTL